MKKFLIGLLATGTILNVHAQSLTSQSVRSGESIDFVLEDCDANEFGQIKILNNTKITATCEPKVCLQYQRGNAAGYVWGDIYLLEGGKKTHLSEYKGRKEKSADTLIENFMKNNVCKTRTFEGIKF